MDAGARRWRQSNFPNLTEHIAPHKDGIGISDAKAIVDAPLQHRYTLSSKTNALWKGRPAARSTHPIGGCARCGFGAAIGMPLCGNDKRRRAMEAAAAVRQRIAQLAGDQ
jgi:hypothetical protein